MLDGVPEGPEQFRAFTVLDRVLGELPDIEIQSDEIVDVACLASGELGAYLFIAVAPGNDIASRLGGQRGLRRPEPVPAFAQLQDLHGAVTDWLV